MTKPDFQNFGPKIYFFYKGDPPKKWEFFKKYFFCICKFRKYSLCQNFIVLYVEMAEIFEKNAKNTFFNTEPYGDPPLKIKISKIGLRHVLSWPKLGLEPKFHESGTFGGFGKRGQSLSRIFNTGPYGPVFYCRSDKSASVLICLVFILYIW